MTAVRYKVKFTLFCGGACFCIFWTVKKVKTGNQDVMFWLEWQMNIFVDHKESINSLPVNFASFYCTFAIPFFCCIECYSQPVLILSTKIMTINICWQPFITWLNWNNNKNEKILTTTITAKSLFIIPWRVQTRRSSWLCSGVQPRSQ